MEFLSATVFEILFWGLFIPIVCCEAIGIERRISRRGRRLLSKNGRYSTERSGNNKLLECSYLGDAKSPGISDDEQRGHDRIIVSGRGDKNNLRELRKHQRRMKLKYHKNPNNLLFYCYYKGITEKYYETLGHC